MAELEAVAMGLGSGWSYRQFAEKAEIPLLEAIGRVNRLLVLQVIRSIGQGVFAWVPPADRVDPLFNTRDEAAIAKGRLRRKPRPTPGDEP